MAAEDSGLRVAVPTPSSVQMKWLELGWEWDGYRSPAHAERILPRGSVEIVWNLGGPMTFFDGIQERRFEDTPVLIGVRASPYWVDTRHAQHLAALVLRPATISSLLGWSAEDLANGFHALSDFPEAARLIEALGQSDHATRFRAVGRALCRRGPPTPSREATALLRTWREDPQRSVGSIRSQLGISHPTFVRRVREALGLAPARYRQLMRLCGVLPRMQGPRPDLARVAVEGGYADQAHFARSFRELTGLTATGYRPLLEEHFFNVADPSVSFGSRP